MTAEWSVQTSTCTLGPHYRIGKRERGRGREKERRRMAGEYVVAGDNGTCAVNQVLTSWVAQGSAVVKVQIPALYSWGPPGLAML